MARELTIRIEVETEKAKAELRELERQMRELHKAATDGAVGIGEFETKQQALALAIARTKGEIKEYTQSQQQVAGTTKAAASSTDELVSVVKRWIGPAVLGAAVKQTIDWAGALSDLSSRTGMSTTRLQQLSVIAEKNGASMASLSQAITQVSDRLAGRDKSAVKAVEDLGLSLDTLLRMRPDELFVTLARAIQGVEDPYKRAQYRQDLFARSGQELAGTIEDVAQGLDQRIPAASAQAIAALDTIGDAWTGLMHISKVAIAEILNAALQMPQVLSPALAALAPLLGSGGREAGAFAGRRQGDLLLGAVSGGQFTAAAGTALGGASGAIISSARAGAADINLSTPTSAALSYAEQLRQAEAGVRRLTEAQRADIAAARQMGIANDKVAESLGLSVAVVQLYEKQLAGLERQAKKTTPALKEVGLSLGLENYAIARLGFKQAAPSMGDLDALRIAGAKPTIGTSLTGMLYGFTGQHQGVTPAGLPAKPGFWSSAFGGAAGFGGGLGSTILSAFTGGGKVGQSIGGFLGQGFGGQLGKGVTEWAGKLTSKLGGMIGGALGSVLPGIGTLLGGLAGDFFGKLFGGDAKKTREARDQWLAQAGGIDEVRKMADYAGVSIDKLLSTRKSKVFEAEVRKLEAAFAAVQQRVQATVTDLGTLAERGGLVSADLAARITRDLDKPEVQQAFEQFVQQQLQQAAQGLTTFLEAAKDLPLSAKSAEALGAALAGVFAQAQKLGLSAREALAMLQPAIDALVVRLEQAGLTGGAAFDELRAMAALFTGEVTGPLLAGLEGLTQAMMGLANAGLLTEDMFQGLAEQVSVTYEKLIEQGVSAEDALRAIAPSLQVLYELMQKFGWTVDDATQALIDQAKEAGLVGDHMKDVMSQVLDVLRAIAKVLGADIPEAARRAGESMRDIPEVPDPRHKPGPPDDVPEYARGSGGVRDFGPGTLAVLHGREAVLTEAQLAQLGGGPTINITIQALDTQSIRTAVEEEIAPQLADVLRQNVRGLRTQTQLALGVRG